MKVTYRRGFAPARNMREHVEWLQQQMCRAHQAGELVPYQPETRHYFHGGMYCREVWRDADKLVIGKVHKKEHFYLIVSGTVAMTTDGGTELVTGPRLIRCKPGTKRAVLSITPALCMTFHVTNATTVEEAEKELVEDDDTTMYAPGNLVVAHEPQEVLP